MFRTLKDVEEAPLSSYFGVPPPPKKCQMESEPQKKRVLSEKWLQEVSWLQTNDERTEMCCRICRENPTLADKNSAFYMYANARCNFLSGARLLF